MKLTLPTACSKYGADMGRRSILPANCNALIKLRLTRLPFVDGDYDRWGAYWGSPANVWCAWGEDDETQVRIFVRGDIREIAKEAVRDLLPNARFYR